ncbi:hypothetical protein PGTUg99_037023 [Puccinia graminis f. sp. tritici]|uniref:Uncharacterized protein n=1 Tax=Puccinia graminis f. sp. tritici TaxID=56615 RepID=A0A5B0PQA9_PUCGR|nr:hypothetical protein PGTUg99_037023 [Puccinia graminis f. sp. tritici]
MSPPPKGRSPLSEDALPGPSDREAYVKLEFNPIPSFQGDGVCSELRGCLAEEPRFATPGSTSNWNEELVH